MWNSQTSLLKITGFLNKEKSTIKIINAVNLLKISLMFAIKVLRFSLLDIINNMSMLMSLSVYN